MRIYREWLGGAEELDLGVEDMRRYFIDDIIQDEEAGEEMIARILEEEEVVTNEHDPIYIERYTLLTHKPDLG